MIYPSCALQEIHLLSRVSWVLIVSIEGTPVKGRKARKGPKKGTAVFQLQALLANSSFKAPLREKSIIITRHLSDSPKSSSYPCSSPPAPPPAPHAPPPPPRPLKAPLSPATCQNKASHRSFKN